MKNRGILKILKILKIKKSLILKGSLPLILSTAVYSKYSKSPRVQEKGYTAPMKMDNYIFRASLFCGQHFSDKDPAVEHF